MAAATDLERHRKGRAEQVEQLRRRIAEVSGKMETPGVRRISAGGSNSAQETLLQTSDPPIGPSADALPEQPVPGALPRLLPRGTVAVLSGARSLMLRMVAAATAEGGHAAIVGQPDVGLLAAVEMGADLSRIAVIPHPGSDPVEVAAVLLDGLDLVVLALAGRSVPMSRARAVTARARQKGCTLLVTGGDWQGASVRLDARVCGYEMVGAGGGWDPRAGADRPGAVGHPGQEPDSRAAAHRSRWLAVSRVLALWCMDWPAVGAAAAAGLPATDPVAVTLANRVIACSAAARAVGVRRGLRRREAQARCPQLHVVTADPARDARHFEGVTAAVDECGAASGGVAARSACGVGPGCIALLRIRTGGRRATGRRGGLGGSRMSDGYRRSVGHRGVRGQGGTHRRAGSGRVVPVRAVHPAAGHRTQSFRSRS